jgi:hypothetical protein
MITRAVMIELLQVSIRDWSDALGEVIDRLEPGSQDHRDVLHTQASMKQTLQALSHLPPLTGD